ncbi:MAG: cation:proton antiporter [Candidatus Bathyarchaeia archaeon]
MVFAIAGVIIFVGFLANLIFKKTTFPDIPLLILTGIIFGPLLGLFTPEDFLPVTPIFAALALTLILFQGGLGMEIYTVLAQSFRATVLGFLYVIFATLFVSIFGHFILGLSWIEALILGPMTAGTSSAIIIPLVSRLSVSDDVKATLSLESTITDVFNIILVIVFLKMFLGSAVNIQETMSSLFARFAVGMMFGAIVGIVWVKILDVVGKQEYIYMLTLAVLLLCYAGAEFLGGSGALSALVFGIILGNYGKMKVLGVKVNSKLMPKLIETIRDFQGEITFLVRAFFFVLLGLLYVPDLMGSIYAGSILAVNLVLRNLAVRISTYKSELYKYRGFMTLTCGTGLANAVLSLTVYSELAVRQIPSASLYPLIVTNIILMNNIVTSLTPLIMRGSLRADHAYLNKK